MAKNIKKKVNAIQRELHGNVTFDSLKAYVVKNGWRVCVYDDDSELVKILGLCNYAQKADSFLCNSNVKVIFIKKGYSEEKTRYLLAHEIGHIELGHQRTSSTSTTTDEISCENEANRFAELLLTPNATKRNKPIIASIVTIILILVAFAVYGWFKQPVIAPPIQQEQQKEQNSVINTENDIFVITKTGDRYHLPDCYYVRDKEDTTEITLEDALDRGYKPCKICIGE